VKKELVEVISSMAELYAVSEMTMGTFASARKLYTLNKEGKEL
jgi:hypothetical protein